MDDSEHDIERPAKRPCLSNNSSDEGDLPPDFDLPAARAQNDSRLKSLFEGIFAKYSQDFTAVGDEIDLATGDIVVDNGHLLGLRAEDDTGKHSRSWLLGGDLAGAGEEDSDADDEDAKGEEYFSMTPTPPVGPSLNEQQTNTDVDDPLDFVFTFKSSGATGHSPVPKEPYISRPINPITMPKPASKPYSKPQDPLWEVPDLPQSSTPTIETRKKHVSFTPIVRSPSPPGSGSIWAVSKRARPRSEMKPKTTPRKRLSAAKRKYHSSPVTHDWSFAAVPDGDESDDPLQDNTASPTPSRMKVVRGKRRISAKDHDGPSGQREYPPEEHPARAIEVGVQDAYQEVGHGDKDAGEQEDEVPDATRQDVPAVPTLQDSPPRYDATPNVDPEDHDHVNDHAGKQIDEAPKSMSENDVPLLRALRPSSTPKTGPDIQSTQSPDNTPRRRWFISPDEARLVMCMMHKQGKKVADVMPLLPGRNYHSIWHWFYTHWTVRLTNPPALSAPWSQPELAALFRLSTQSGLSWARIQREFEGRSRHEVEFEMLRAFVGEGFTSGMNENTEGNEEQMVPIKDESDSEAFLEDMNSGTWSDNSTDDYIKEESDSGESLENGLNGYRRASLGDTAEEESGQPHIPDSNTSDSKASASNRLLGIFISPSK
ncbi:hypothetical protein N7535_008180 [Penicillium sp. DV-2018c]|nr:hypothetical protein N7461_004217 [Penicillium sp. DV-2018c]KAJ5566542.1 hypothetical protein N7535_008180 [Penicillium sp. DV-2018c]